ncbi:MAG: cell surface protein [Myxococcota bacterium]
MKRRTWLLVGLLAGFGCGDPATEDDEGLDGGAELGPDYAAIEGNCEADPGRPADPFIDCIEDFSPSADAAFGHSQLPGIIEGPPMGAGEMAGGMDVISLGCGGSITLAFDEPMPTDGPGPDFIVFENPFVSGSTTFVEPAQVFVSDDGEHWRSFPCELDGQEGDATGCAGLSPVLAADATTATNPDTAGGDAFDLADVGLTRARYIRLVDRSEEHYGSQIWCAAVPGGFDLDAIAVVEGTAR